MAVAAEQIKPLTAAAFAPYGDVVEARESAQHFAINYGHTERYHNLAKVDTLAEGGTTGISLFQSKPLPLPITIEIMERHPLSSQLFMPLSANPYLVVVAPPGEFDETAIEIFLAGPKQGVNYHPGTWHHYSLALGGNSDFLVVDRISLSEHSNPNNCDEVQLKTPLLLNPEF